MRCVNVLPSLFLSLPRARTFASATAAVDTSTSAYQKLSNKLQTITRLQRLSALANWDQLVMMPQSDENNAERGAQLAALAGVVHASSTAPELRELIALAESEVATLDAREAATVREAKRDFDREAALPAELAERQAALSSEACTPVEIEPAAAHCRTHGRRCALPNPRPPLRTVERTAAAAHFR